MAEDDRDPDNGNTVSKSILRVALDKLMSSGLPDVYYWSSFEIVRSLRPHLSYTLFGEDGNTRHVNRKALHLTLKAFTKHCFSDANVSVNARQP